ncbi:transposase, partial [Bacillus sp. TL12]|uniref:transposase n=1 Tax=Bacillus sp. TL12 TaxID=2894756 RepID=UPI001F5269B3
YAKQRVSFKRYASFYGIVIKIDKLFDWKVIEDHYEDMLRVVISIRTGRIHPSTILNKLSVYRDSAPSLSS